MNEDYTQPFYVPFEMARRMGYDRPFYLPPIEPIQKPETLPIIPPEHRLYGELQQLKARQLYLDKKLNEHLDKKKKYLYK